MKKEVGFLRIKGETFPYEVLVSIGTTGEQILKYADKKFVDAFSKEEREAIKDLGTRKGYTLRLENRAIFMWLRHFPVLPEEFGFLAHEIFHTADLILRRAGVSLSDDSDEVWAYHIDWLTKKIYEAYGFVNTRSLKSKKK